MQRFTWQRAVVKVGSSLVAPTGSKCTGQFILPLVRFISESRALGKEVIIVSSGSVAAGREAVPVTHVPSIAEKQAMAAIGQMQMMANWARFFDVPCAQILLTADDFANRTRYVNIQNTLRELFKHGAMPIVNENDTVATAELKVGDNDNLGAYTALVAQADTLIMCSDIDGLYTADPRKTVDAKLIPRVEEIDESIHALAGGAGSTVGTGGMRTKIQAAEKCANSGIQTLIVNGRKSDVFDSLLSGVCPGTVFVASRSPDSARAKWLRYSLRSRGQLTIDSGAAHALRNRGSSLLCAGIEKVSGHFDAGDCVEFVFRDEVLGQGLCLYNSQDLQRVKGLHSQQISDVLGYSHGKVAVHKDDLIIMGKNTTTIQPIKEEE
ncbi:glutamate 5-kinase [Alteromonas oceanisediminis]|uniref:glutamate 5-kinase n=1 Tax=Alteromonas oceanisediminis TaxID=2836180 RepID=UPI001BDB1656|nr:glutamate 5-kinase [Alteromonas oceanisediminis]MBT0587900.1 glutamate 5-kinase [Alteromonas oceanisediminis]